MTSSKIGPHVPQQASVLYEFPFNSSTISQFIILPIISNPDFTLNKPSNENNSLIPQFFQPENQESRSFGCQANMQNITQEIACQTNYPNTLNRNDFDIFDPNIDDDDDDDLLTSINPVQESSESPYNRSNLQSQETQTFNQQFNRDDSFMNYTNISTQTLGTISLQTYTQTNSIVYNNAVTDHLISTSIGCQTGGLNQYNPSTNTYTQTNLQFSLDSKANFELDLDNYIDSQLQQEQISNDQNQINNTQTYFQTDTNLGNYSSIEFMPQTSLSNNIASSCQTDDNLFFNSTQSIQTQTNNDGNEVSHTDTQTDPSTWTLMEDFNFI